MRRTRLAAAALTAALPLLSLTTPTPAQARCQFNTVQARSTGPGCNPVFQTIPTLTPRLDVTTCTLQIQVTAFSGCCNSFLRNRVLVLGDGPQNLPFPQIGQGCVLWVNPITFLWLPSSGGDTFLLPIPPALPPLTLHAQAAGHYVTFGVSHDLAFTDGASLSLQ